jgi:hypothetical protein
MKITAISKAADVSRKATAQTVEETLAAIKSGEINPLEAYLRLKSLADVVAKVLKDPEVQRAALDEADKYDKADRQKLGVSFEVRNGPGRWDFSGDKEWAALDAGKKAREAALKAAHEAGLVADVHGEEMKVTKKEGGRILSVKL